MANWTNLVAGGRAKAIGIPWSEEEWVELKRLRDEEGKEFSEGASILRGSTKTRAELEKAAKEAGVDFTDEAPDEVLEKATKPKKKK